MAGAKALSDWLRCCRATLEEVDMELPCGLLELVLVYRISTSAIQYIHIYAAKVGGAEDNSERWKTCRGRQCELFGGGKVPSISLPKFETDMLPVTWKAKNR